MALGFYSFFGKPTGVGVGGGDSSQYISTYTGEAGNGRLQNWGKLQSYIAGRDRSIDTNKSSTT